MIVVVGLSLIVGVAAVTSLMISISVTVRRVTSVPVLVTVNSVMMAMAR